MNLVPCFTSVHKFGNCTIYRYIHSFKGFGREKKEKRVRTIYAMVNENMRCRTIPNLLSVNSYGDIQTEIYVFFFKPKGNPDS